VEIINMEERRWGKRRGRYFQLFLKPGSMKE